MKCDLCGSLSPKVKCEQCNNQTFCGSCDDMFHRHPKRKSHIRKVKLFFINFSENPLYSFENFRSFSPLRLHQMYDHHYRQKVNRSQICLYHHHDEIKNRFYPVHFLGERIRYDNVSSLRKRKRT